MRTRRLRTFPQHVTEAAGERLFRELEERRNLMYVGDKCRLWPNKLLLGYIVVQKAKLLIGTDPVSYRQAMMFVDLACGALEVKSGDASVPVGFVFSLPGRPDEHFYHDSETARKDKLAEHLIEMDADIHMLFVCKDRKDYDGNQISMYFLIDDWVQLEFAGSLTSGPGMNISKHFRCDGQAGVEQCLKSIPISH